MKAIIPVLFLLITIIIGKHVALADENIIPDYWNINEMKSSVVKQHDDGVYLSNIDILRKYIYHYEDGDEDVKSQIYNTYASCTWAYIRTLPNGEYPDWLFVPGVAEVFFLEDYNNLKSAMLLLAVKSDDYSKFLAKELEQIQNSRPIINNNIEWCIYENLFGYISNFHKWHYLDNAFSIEQLALDLYFNEGSTINYREINNIALASFMAANGDSEKAMAYYLEYDKILEGKIYMKKQRVILLFLLNVSL